MEPVGGKIDLRDIVLGDDTMSVLEIWGAEYQENNCALIRAKDVPIIERVAKRERSGYCVVGTITGDGRVVVHDAKDNTTPVDLPLDKVRRQPPYYLSSVRILLHICPHSTVFVSLYYYMCVGRCLGSCRPRRSTRTTRTWCPLRIPPR